MWRVTRTGLMRLRPGAAGTGPAAVRPASVPRTRTYSVTIIGTNIAGQPAGGRACQVQPMMTVCYGVVGLRLSGSAAPGQQVVRVLVRHLQLARAAKVTGATMSVSFDSGKTWRGARMTGRAGSYAGVFRARTGARVTLRTSASDAAGGSVTETITRAYQVGS